MGLRDQAVQAKRSQDAALDAQRRRDNERRREELANDVVSVLTTRFGHLPDEVWVSPTVSLRTGEAFARLDDVWLHLRRVERDGDVFLQTQLATWCERDQQPHVYLNQSSHLDIPAMEVLGEMIEWLEEGHAKMTVKFHGKNVTAETKCSATHESYESPEFSRVIAGNAVADRLL